ncbi:MAG: ABC transporter ATP-binding protein [Candidatus Thorarchaeota archaeon]
MELLEVEGLTVEYTTRRGTARALDNVSLSVTENTTLGIVGESGCGKSTFGRAIIRLVPYPGRIVSGRIVLNNDEELRKDTHVIPAGPIDIMKISEHKMGLLRGRKISYIFQDPMTSLNPMMNIGDHFVELIRAHEPDVSKEEALDRARGLLNDLGILSNRVSDYPHQFSGGMRQRVMVGLGLALNPRLLIADEPTTSLDVVVEAQILDLMADLKRKFNLTMIMITHNLGVLAQTADDIAVIYAGRIVERAGAESLFERPKHPYTRALLQSVADVTRPDKKLTWIPGAPPDLTQLSPGCKYEPRCPFAKAQCREVEPLLEPVEKDGVVACHFWEE